MPSIGGLIFALHQKPSRRPLTIAGVASAVWMLVGCGLGYAMLAPEWSKASGIAGLLGKPQAMIVAAAIIIPIALFWLLALLAWRAQELKLMSSAMTEVAIRLAEPDRMAEQQIASVGQAVRRQVSHMNDAVSRALGRASELEALVHNEVASLERSYMQNEHRIRGLLQEMSGERVALVNTSEKVNISLKELGTEIPTLIDRLGEQQLKLAKFIEDAGRNLVALESSLAHNTGQLATAVGTRTEELRGLLTDQTQQIDSVMAGRTQQLQSIMGDGTQQLNTMLAQGHEAIATALEGTTTTLDARLTSHAATVTTALVDHTEVLEGVFDTFSVGLNAALGERTEGIQTVLEEYTRALDQTMESRQQQLDGQLVARTKALDDAFAQRVALFDDTILRSTIAIDSAVADKARALSTALETHAKEIGQVLGQQAGQLDEQIMHGVHAVRRASENVTRQSLKAIEGLAGQADLLKNVSENLVNQIGGVTNRFDQQGQTIMRAANALETANFRIDKTLQNRQLELSETLDKLSGKAESIDRVLGGYSTSLEGTFNEAENRARSVGEQLTRTTEERSRQALGEIERMQVAASGETDRALADLRTRFSNVSREVHDEIGTMSQRFADSSEEMRRQAQRTLADIESEQQRLRQQMERLPEATRASAETMRSSLQDQLKALEQLSQLSTREAARAEISPPLSSLQPAREVAAQPAQPSPRSISSVTQRLASELAAARGRAEPASMVPSPMPSAPVPQPTPLTLQPTPAPVTTAPPARVAPPGMASPPAVRPAAAATNGRDGWSLGDLLARASEDEEANRSTTGINIAAIARALDATTASAIWSRFRAGQRGVMVRSIYTVDGRAAFDEVHRRYKTEPPFRDTVDRYMVDFEQLLRDGDQRDASGRTAQSYVTSDSGRVYLFLAHASGRLA